jgi:hypothetical protein
MENPQKNITLLKDNEWSIVDGEACRVVHFTPFASIVDGKIKNAGLSMPYCAITIECKNLPYQAIGYITHKIDFTNLWKTFKERGVKENEEVIITWTRDNYKKGFPKTLSMIYPKLWVMICRKNAFEAINDPHSYTDLDGMTYMEFISPIVSFKPDIMQ